MPVLACVGEARIPCPAGEPVAKHRLFRQQSLFDRVAIEADHPGPHEDPVARRRQHVGQAHQALQLGAGRPPRRENATPARRRKPAGNRRCLRRMAAGVDEPYRILHVRLAVVDPFPRSQIESGKLVFLRRLPRQPHGVGRQHGAVGNQQVFRRLVSGGEVKMPAGDGPELCGITRALPWAGQHLGLGNTLGWATPWAGQHLGLGNTLGWATPWAGRTVGLRP